MVDRARIIAPLLACIFRALSPCCARWGLFYLVLLLFFSLSVLLHMTTPLDKQSAHSYGLNSRHYGLSWFTSSAFALLCGISRFLGCVDPPNPIISPRSFWISIHRPRSHFRITCLTRASSVQSIVSLIRPYYNPYPISSHLCHVFFFFGGVH